MSERPADPVAAALADLTTEELVQRAALDPWGTAEAAELRRRREEEPVLGCCPHGVNLDRDFCPEGCRV